MGFLIGHASVGQVPLVLAVELVLAGSVDLDGVVLQLPQLVRDDQFLPLLKEVVVLHQA